MIETTEVYTFLDDLRESGVTNMFGSPAYVEREYSISQAEANELVAGWMESVENGSWDMDNHEYSGTHSEAKL